MTGGQTRVHAFGDDALGEDDAVGLAARIGSGEVSSAELVDAGADVVNAHHLLATTRVGGQRHRTAVQGGREHLSRFDDGQRDRRTRIHEHAHK